MIHRNVEDFRGRHAMKIGARVESIDEAAIAGKLGEDAQLDLRIVGNHQLSAFRMSGEAAPVFHRVRHLLDVWVGAGEPAGRRADLAKVSVQTVRWSD